MITVKERYYARSEGEMTTAKRYTIVECHNDDEVWFKMKEVAHGEYVLYSDYKELEQDLKDSELRRKDLLTSLQRANAQKAELEQEKAELLEFVRDIAYNDISRNDITLDWVQKASWELLNKHTDKPDAI